jgi:hypothetical protein
MTINETERQTIRSELDSIVNETFVNLSGRKGQRIIFAGLSANCRGKTYYKSSEEGLKSSKSKVQSLDKQARYK